jgi:hypothetical protein
MSSGGSRILSSGGHMKFSLRERRSAMWRSLCALFPRGRRRGYQAQERLTQAYQEVFTGKPNREDQELVLADLAKESGFFQYAHASAMTSEQLWQREGARVLFGRIYEHITLEEADRRALETAARREAAVDVDPHEGTK